MPSAKGATDLEGYPYPAGPYIAAYIAAALCHALELLALVGNHDNATQSWAVHRHPLEGMAMHRHGFAKHDEALPWFAKSGEGLSAFRMHRWGI